MYSFQVYPGNVLATYDWRVVDAGNVPVWRGWYSVGGAEHAVIRDLAAQDPATTVEEDLRPVESVQRGLKSLGDAPEPLVVDPGCSLNTEHSIRVLKQWMCEALSL